MIQNIRERLPSTELIWADKIALLFGILVSSLLLFLWSLAFLVVGNLGAEHLWDHFGILGVELGALTVGSVWIMMRAADFLGSGLTHWLFDDRSAQKKDVILYSPISDKRRHLCVAMPPANQPAAIEPVRL